MAIIATNPARAVATAFDLPVETVADGAVGLWPVPHRATPVRYQTQVLSEMYEHGRNGSMWAVNLRVCDADSHLVNQSGRVDVLVVAMVMLANVQRPLFADAGPASDRLRTMVTQGRHDEIGFTMVPIPQADDKMPTHLTESLIDLFAGDDQTAG